MYVGVLVVCRCVGGCVGGCVGLGVWAVGMWVCEVTVGWKALR